MYFIILVLDSNYAAFCWGKKLFICSIIKTVAIHTEQPDSFEPRSSVLCRRVVLW